MLISTPVTVVVNGAFVAGTSPARNFAGRIMVPLAPVVVRLVTRAVYDPDARTVVVERAGRRLVVPVVFTEAEMPYVALAPLLLELGARAAYDARSRTLTIEIAPESPVASATPYDLSAPRPTATSVFTPAPPPPTPRVVSTGAPRPRRTPIPVSPSEPDATAPRR